MTDTSSGPTFPIIIDGSTRYECPCPACDGGCPQLTENGGECHTCRQGIHETPEG